MLTCKIKSGILEYPPEGEKHPIIIVVPAKEISQVSYVRDKNGDDHPVYNRVLIPDTKHPRYQRMLKQGITAEKARCQQLWDEYNTSQAQAPREGNAEQGGNNAALFKEIFG